MKQGRQDVTKSWFPCVYLPEQVARETAQLVSSYGAPDEPHEGIVYWAGLPSEDAWVITTVIAPEATTTPGSYTTSVVANAIVVSKTNDLKLQLLAQVHGHPSSWVGHSDGDNIGAFMPYEGFLSIVLPWYGQKGAIPLTKCGIHRYSMGRFVQLSREEIREQFLILPGKIDLRN